MVKLKRRKPDNSIADAIDVRVPHIEHAMQQDVDRGFYGLNVVMKDLHNYGNGLCSLAVNLDTFGEEAFCYQLTYCMWLWSQIEEPYPEDSAITYCAVPLKNNRKKSKEDFLMMVRGMGGTQIVLNGVAVISLTEYINFLEGKAPSVPKASRKEVVHGLKKLRTKAKKNKPKAMKLAGVS